MTLRLSRAEKKELKLLAVNEDQTLNSIVLEAIREYMQTRRRR